RPDESFERLSKVWEETTTEEMLGDPDGFTTLDAKILSAITNVLEGDFARQIDTFKEREGLHFAGSASQAEGCAFRKDTPSYDNKCINSTYPALASVKFWGSPEFYFIPTSPHETNWRLVTQEAREQLREKYPVNYKPKSDDQDIRDAQASAKMLRSTIEGMYEGATPTCRFCCKTEFGCDKCIDANLTVGSPAGEAKSANDIDMEWIADTGSAQELISKNELL
ncbi:unnamed protein product, partial [Symbiodinium sp. CCMP2456]